MSLIVTSNKTEENQPEFSDAFKPYSYQNRLLNTMEIPPNSEVALQSAKINKNGLFVLDRANAGFCTWFNPPIGSGALEHPDLENTTTQPFRAVIGSGEAFRAGGKAERNVEDMANDIQKGLNESTFHPSLITSATTVSNVVTPVYSGVGNQAFEGFKFTATQETGVTNRGKGDIEWTDISKNNAYPLTSAGGQVAGTGEGGFLAQVREMPLCQNEGEVLFDFTGSQLGAGEGGWMCGLSRINRKRGGSLSRTILRYDGDYDYCPNYFDDTMQASATSLVQPWKSPEGVNQIWYADFSVIRHKDLLYVYQSGHSSQRGTKAGITMLPVTYFGAHNVNFPTQYDIGSNGSGYDELKFTLINEEVRIEIGKAGAFKILCDFTTLKAAGAVKRQCFNPVNAAEWAMYPVAAADSVGGNKSIAIQSIDHYTNYPKWDEALYHNYDWWGWSQFYNETAFCKSLEQRDWNNYNRTVSGINGNGLLIPKLLTGKGMTDYVNSIITSKSIEYGNSTDECNTQSTLGFIGASPSLPTVARTDLVIINQSAQAPKLISNISLFIRLNNFTQQTMNARQGTISKIISHLPRFDNSGNETGGLYFEPHEKTYLALNNPDTLYINSFDIDIVYENETLCTALTGKTIVCLHIRPQK
tara:strand:- start:4849 stop:6777 length:1929 start_codon:yes stop_codon:yes gene_type:complete